MKQKFVDYLNQIKMAETYVIAIEESISNIESLYGVTVDDIFVNMIKEEERINVNSLWLFYGDSLVECKDFIRSKNYDIVKYLSNIQYTTIELQDVDVQMRTIDDKSIVKIYAVIGKGGNLSCSLSACGENCRKCIEVYKRFFVQNVVNI